MYICCQRLERRSHSAACPEAAAGLRNCSGAGRKGQPPAIEEPLRKADVVMMLRVQQERLAGLKLDADSYVAHYQLTPARLKLAKPDAIVMHPGPMVRGMEIQSGVADGPQSVIEEQVQNGVYVRMAILASCLGVA